MKLFPSLINQLPSAPVYSRTRAHITSKYLLSTFRLQQLGVPASLRFHHHWINVWRTSFDVSEQLVVSLYFVNHLAMDVFDVKVFTSDDERTASDSGI